MTPTELEILERRFVFLGVPVIGLLAAAGVIFQIVEFKKLNLLHLAAPVNIRLKVEDAANGTCSQNGIFAPIEVTSGSYVSWGPANAADNLDVRFKFNGTPFYVTQGTGPMNSGQVYAAVATTYYYDTITIGNTGCRNSGQLGLRIRPGP